jgi:hypothetical protein
MGDSLTAIGAVRYLSTCYDQVDFVVRESNRHNVQKILQDDPSIHVVGVSGDVDISPKFGCPKEVFDARTQGYDLFISGIHRLDGCHDLSLIPFSFYRDFGVPETTFWDYFHVAEYIESTQMYEAWKARLGDLPYLFIHNETSNGVMFSAVDVEERFGVSRDKVLFVNAASNIYPVGHHFHDLAQMWVGLAMPLYRVLIQRASGVMVTDSSFYCFALNIGVDSTQCYCVMRGIGMTYMDIFEQGVLPLFSRPKVAFTRITLSGQTIS